MAAFTIVSPTQEVASPIKMPEVPLLQASAAPKIELGHPQVMPCFECTKLRKQHSLLCAEHENLTIYWHEAERRALTFEAETLRLRHEVERKVRAFVEVSTTLAEVQELYKDSRQQGEKLRDCVQAYNLTMLNSLRTTKQLARKVEYIGKWVNWFLEKLRIDVLDTSNLLAEQWTVRTLKTRLESTHLPAHIKQYLLNLRSLVQSDPSMDAPRKRKFLLPSCKSAASFSTTAFGCRATMLGPATLADRLDPTCGNKVESPPRPPSINGNANDTHGRRAFRVTFPLLPRCNQFERGFPVARRSSSDATATVTVTRPSRTFVSEELSEDVKKPDSKIRVPDSITHQFNAQATQACQAICRRESQCSPASSPAAEQPPSSAAAHRTEACTAVSVTEQNTVTPRLSKSLSPNIEESSSNKLLLLRKRTIRKQESLLRNMSLPTVALSSLQILPYDESSTARDKEMSTGNNNYSIAGAKRSILPSADYLSPTTALPVPDIRSANQALLRKLSTERILQLSRQLAAEINRRSTLGSTPVPEESTRRNEGQSRAARGRLPGLAAGGSYVRGPNDPVDEAAVRNGGTVPAPSCPKSQRHTEAGTHTLLSRSLGVPTDMARLATAQAANNIAQRNICFRTGYAKHSAIAVSSNRDGSVGCSGRSPSPPSSSGDSTGSSSCGRNKMNKNASQSSSRSSQFSHSANNHSPPAVSGPLETGRGHAAEASQPLRKPGSAAALHRHHHHNHHCLVAPSSQNSKLRKNTQMDVKSVDALAPPIGGEPVLRRTGRIGRAAVAAPHSLRERRNPHNMSRTRPKRDASKVVDAATRHATAGHMLERSALQRHAVGAAPGQGQVPTTTTTAFTATAPFQSSSKLLSASLAAAGSGASSPSLRPPADATGGAAVQLASAATVGTTVSSLGNSTTAVESVAATVPGGGYRSGSAGIARNSPTSMTLFNQFIQSAALLTGNPSLPPLASQPPPSSLQRVVAPQYRVNTGALTAADVSIHSSANTTLAPFLPNGFATAGLLASTFGNEQPGSSGVSGESRRRAIDGEALQNDAEPSSLRDAPAPSSTRLDSRHGSWTGASEAPTATSRGAGANDAETPTRVEGSSRATRRRRRRQEHRQQPRKSSEPPERDRLQRPQIPGLPRSSWLSRKNQVAPSPPNEGLPSQQLKGSHDFASSIIGPLLQSRSCTATSQSEEIPSSPLPHPTSPFVESPEATAPPSTAHSSKWLNAPSRRSTVGARSSSGISSADGGRLLGIADAGRVLGPLGSNFCSASPSVKHSSAASTRAKQSGPGLDRGLLVQRHMTCPSAREALMSQKIVPGSATAAMTGALGSSNRPLSPLVKPSRSPVSATASIATTQGVSTCGKFEVGASVMIPDSVALAPLPSSRNFTSSSAIWTTAEISTAPRKSVKMASSERTSGATDEPSSVEEQVAKSTTLKRLARSRHCESSKLSGRG